MKFGDSDYENMIHRARLALANSNPGWDEHKHPRRADGKFGSGGDASEAGADDKEKERIAKMKRELAHAMGEVQGAVQRYSDIFGKYQDDLDERDFKRECKVWSAAIALNDVIQTNAEHQWTD